MGSELSNEQQRQTANECKRKLEIIRHFWLDKFPDGDDYDSSLWAMWQSRIREGHKSEEIFIAKVADRWISNLTEEQKELMPDDMFTDDYYHTFQLTNAMYAAMVVKLWSSIEGFLKDLVNICKRVHNSNKKVSYKFEEIEKSFKKDIGVNLEQLPSYSIINAIRILNNSFKHSEGFYQPELGKPHTHIDPNLLTKWKCISKRFVDLKEIDYTVLPIQELVAACKLFCQHLISATEKSLEGESI